MKNFFVNFMMNDKLGFIFNVYVVCVDKSFEGVLDSDCLCFVYLVLIVVDFFKIGKNVIMLYDLRVNEWLDFMEKEGVVIY